MMIELSKLRPNPFRNFRVDPIDEENVEKLAASITEHDFWGGPTCRRMKDGTYQIAAGHHRIEAAKRAGIKTADIHVGAYTDEEMIRVYAVENATQRGNTSTAMGGSVASAIRFLAKALLTGCGEKFFSASPKANTPDASNIGRDVVVTFLHDVPGINSGTVQLALAQIKASGEYATILAEVQAEIEADTAEAMKAAEKARAADEAAEAARVEAEARKKASDEAYEKARTEAAKAKAEREQQEAAARAKVAEKHAKQAAEQSAKFDAMRSTRTAAKAATEKAAEREVTFDRNGVAPMFTNPNHLRAFQECVEGAGVKPYLRVEQQVDLAKALVAKAKSDNREMTGAFIRETVISMVVHVKTQQREMTKAQAEKLRREDLQKKARYLQEEFSRSVRGMNAAGIKLAGLKEDWPTDLAFPITGEFREALRHAEEVIKKLSKRI